VQFCHVALADGVGAEHAVAAQEAGNRGGIVKRFQPRMAGSAFVTWTAPATALPIPWNEALRRLEQPDTIHDRH
jgi:hypothetical protein